VTIDLDEKNLGLDVVFVPHLVDNLARVVKRSAGGECLDIPAAQVFDHRSLSHDAIQGACVVAPGRRKVMNLYRVRSSHVVVGTVRGIGVRNQPSYSKVVIGSENRADEQSDRSERQHKPPCSLHGSEFHTLSFFLRSESTVDGDPGVTPITNTVSSVSYRSC
jgi:hypothetical protein